MSEGLSLRNRNFILDAGGKIGLLLLLSTLVLPILAIWYINEETEPGSGMLGVSAFLEHLHSQVDDAAFANRPVAAAVYLLFYLGLPLYLLYFYLANRFERLTLTPAGIRYISPLPDAFRFLRPDWYLSWESITGALVKLPDYGVEPGLTTLTLQTRSGKRRLRPFFWISPDTRVPAMQTLFERLKRRSREQNLDRVMATDLVRYVHARGTAVRVDQARQVFQLEDNPWSQAMTLLLLALIGYALVDTFIFKTEVLAEAPPWLLYTATGLLVTLGGGHLLLRTGVPWPTGTGLALATGLAFSAAMHPALIRLSILTDRGGQETYTYTLQPDRTWQPQTVGVPPLSIDEAPEYWAGFNTGSTHRFTLRKGGLGFWQLDQVPLRDAYHGYYERVREEKRKAHGPVEDNR